MQTDNGKRRTRDRGDHVVDRHECDTVASFDRVSAASVIDQNSSHDLCSDGKEMGAVSPINLPVEQPKVGFVDEGRRLQGMPLALLAKLTGCNTTELCINQRDETVERRPITPNPVVQKGRHFAGEVHT